MSEQRRRPGCLGRLVKFIVVTTGLFAIAAFADHLVTTRVLQGSWQYAHAGWSEATVARLLDHLGEGTEPGAGGTSPGRSPGAAEAVAKIGNSLVSALTSHVTLELTAGGYRLDGSTTGARIGTSLMRALASGPRSIGGCSSGTYRAAFPLVQAVCGDGTGRTLWFVMRKWPGDDLELFLLPLGDAALRDKVEKMTAGGNEVEAARAARELLTFRFSRRSR